VLLVVLFCSPRIAPICRDLQRKRRTSEGLLLQKKQARCRNADIEACRRWVAERHYCPRFGLSSRRPVAIVSRSVRHGRGMR